MRPNPCHWSLGAALALLVTAAPGQGDLVDRMVAAASDSDPNQYQGKLQQIFAPLTTAQIVDALAGRPDALHSYVMARIAGELQRRPDLVDLWQQEPRARGRRAPVFAALQFDWLERHARAPLSEQQDIEQLAPFFPAYDSQRIGAMRSDDAAIRRSATILQRLAVRAARERSNAELAASLRPANGKEPGYFPAEYCDPFALANWLCDEDPAVRAGAAAMLRKRLQLALPVGLTHALAGHENPWLRIGAVKRAPATMTAAARIAAVDAGGDADEFLPLDYVAAQPEQIRRQIGTALFQAGLRVPLGEQTEPAPDGSGGVPFGLGPNADLDLKAFGLFSRAIQATPIASELVLGLVLDTTEPRLRRRAVRAALFPTTTTSGAKTVLSLLDDADSEVALAAAQQADRLLAERELQELQELRAKVLALAMLAAQQNCAALTFRPGLPDMCTGRPPTVLPMATDSWSQLVYTASKLGENRLLAPLLAELVATRARAGGVGRPGDPHEEYLFICLAALAPQANPQQATTLFDLAVDNLASSGAMRALIALGPAAPQALIDRAEKLVTAPNPADFRVGNATRAIACSFLVAAGKRYPAARARKLFEQFGFEDRDARSLLLSCPEVVLAAWRANGRQRAAMLRALDAVARLDMTPLVPAMLSWPAADTAGILNQWRDKPIPPLSVIAHVANEPELGNQLPWWIEHTELPADGLAMLQGLAAHASQHVALAAALRAAELGERGQALLELTTARLLRSQDDRVVNDTLQFAAKHVVRADGWQQAAERLRAMPQYADTADIAAIRLGGDGLEQARNSRSPGQVLGLAAIDVDAETERLLQPTRDAFPLIASESAVSRAAGLRLAGRIEVWSNDLERFVVSKTLDEAAIVRAAAYAALATRDRELWPCAWLAVEAGFDPDPTVREVAMRAAARTQPDGDK